jgi:uncharacterized membrane protein
MKKGRLEAFSDGVLAIIITIMVLELKVPHAVDFAGLKPLIPVFISYVLSFIYIGIYWNNHHHMISTVENVNGSILWANLHLLFWLSIIPFTTGWMGANYFSADSLALYGVVLLMCAIAYFILQSSIITHNGKNSVLAKAVGKDLKGKLSPLFYMAAIPVGYWSQWLAGAIYVLIALIWLIPDKRIEKEVNH